MTKGEAGYETWSAEKLRRKADQHWDMAGLARQDRDAADAERHTKLARLYEEALHG